MIEPESKPQETVPIEISDVARPEAKVEMPVHVMQSSWSAQKRIKKVQLETLEQVYRRSKRPTVSPITSLFLFDAFKSMLVKFHIWIKSFCILLHSSAPEQWGLGVGKWKKILLKYQLSFSKKYQLVWDVKCSWLRPTMLRGGSCDLGVWGPSLIWDKWICFLAPEYPNLNTSVLPVHFPFYLVCCFHVHLFSFLFLVCSGWGWMWWENLDAPISGYLFCSTILELAVD